MDRHSAVSHDEQRHSSHNTSTVAISTRTLWTIAGIALLLTALSLLLLKGIHVLLLLYIGIVVAEGIRPVIDWLQARHIPRPLAVLTTYLVTVGTVFGVGWLLLQPLINQLVGLANRLPQFAAQAQQLLEQAQNRVGQSQLLQQATNAAQGSFGNAAQNVVSTIVQIPFALSQLLIDIVVILVIAFFWLTGVENLRPFFISLFPARHQGRVQDILNEIEHRTGGYLRGVAIDAIVVGILSGLAVWLIGAPFPLILGMIAAITELIPYFGPWISGGIAVIVTLLSGQVIPALLVAAAYIVIQQVEGHALIPYIMMRAVEVNPLTVVIATLLGLSLLGIVGGILAVPTASIIHVLVVRLTAPMIQAHAKEAGELTDDHHGDNGREQHGDRAHADAEQQPAEAEVRHEAH
ncbi:MAG TPA: AI-2E family transporter [Ktedonobacterales bacterium]